MDHNSSTLLLSTSPDGLCVQLGSPSDSVLAGGVAHDRRVAVDVPGEGGRGAGHRQQTVRGDQVSQGVLGADAVYPRPGVRQVWVMYIGDYVSISGRYRSI